MVFRLQHYRLKPEKEREGERGKEREREGGKEREISV
jgi:hypothetical protein